MEKLGIVLSGGGVRGLAHVGLLKALGEMGIAPQYISGSSSGALVGALYAAGHEAEDMLEFFKTTPVFNFSYYSSKKPGLIDSEKYRIYFERYFPEDKIESLNKSLFITATDIAEGQYRVFSKGPIIRPLLASASLPPVFSPVEIDGRLLSDGGIMNNFPVEPLRPHCRNIIGSFVNPIKPMKARELSNTMKVFQRALDLKFYTSSKSKFHYCNYIFEPGSLYKYGILDTRHIDDIFQIGYTYAISKMAEIVKAIETEGKLRKIVA